MVDKLKIGYHFIERVQRCVIVSLKGKKIMKQTIYQVGSAVRELLRDKSNFIILILIVGFGFIGYQEYQTQKQIAEINKAIIKSEKKTDFRYFNITRTFEDIFKIEIDTKDGRIRR